MYNDDPLRQRVATHTRSHLFEVRRSRRRSREPGRARGGAGGGGVRGVRGAARARFIATQDVSKTKNTTCAKIPQHNVRPQTESSQSDTYYSYCTLHMQV